MVRPESYLRSSGESTVSSLLGTDFGSDVPKAGAFSIWDYVYEPRKSSLRDTHRNSTVSLGIYKCKGPPEETRVRLPVSAEESSVQLRAGPGRRVDLDGRTQGVLPGPPADKGVGVKTTEEKVRIVLDQVCSLILPGTAPRKTPRHPGSGTT